MEPETQSRIKETVLEILRNADMDEMSELKVRNLAAAKLGIDLSGSDQKRFVKSVVNSFLLSQEAADEEDQQVKGKEVEEEEGDEQVTKPNVSSKEYDDDGDLIICSLSNRRRVTIQDFRGRTLVSIREYYELNGKELPSSKGISLTAEQWSAFSKNVPAIEEAIRKMEGRLR